METQTKTQEKLTITAKAVSKLKEFMKGDNKESSALRLGISESGGCCGGVQYALEFADSPRPNETTIESNGVKIFVDEMALSSISDLKIDFVEDKHGAGFKIEAEVKESSCGSGGCGSGGCGSGGCGSGGCSH